MNFKSKIIAIFLICTSAVMFVSCESKEQSSDFAYDRVKEEKMMSNDNLNYEDGIAIDSNSKIQETKFISPQIYSKKTNIDQWIKFKTETENKLLSNERQIQKIKNNTNSNAKQLKKALNLEEDNNDLKKQLDEFNLERKSMLEKCMIRIDKDMLDLTSKLNVITIENKK